MTIESSNPASGSTIASGSQIEVVNSIPLVISTIKLRRTGWDDDTIYSGGVFTSGYTGTRALGAGVEVFTIRKDGYGWTESPFQIVLDDGAIETSLNFYVTGVSVYPEFMTPFGTGGGGGGGTGTGARYLDELQDVTAPSPGDAEVLGWDAGLGQWTPRAPTTPGAHVLDSHTDVTITGAQNDEVLTYQAGVWVNQAAQGGGALDDLSDVTITAPQDNQVLAYDSGTGDWINQASPSGVTDHGALTGLSDDDHAQYHNNARGDARYVPLARTITAGSGLTGGGDLSANRTLAVGQITNSQITSATVADNYVLTADGAGNVNWEVQQGPPGGAIKWTLQEILTSAPIDNNVTTQPANPVILTDTPGVPGTTSLVVWKQNTGDTVPPMQASVPGNGDIGISVDGATASLQIRPTGVRGAQGNTAVTFGGASHAAPSDTYVFGSAATGSATGGTLDLRAGQSATGTGGPVAITGGASAGAGTGGQVTINGGASVSGTDGGVYIGSLGTTAEVQIGSAAPGTNLKVYDSTGSPGADGQVLTSTGLLTRWEDSVGGGAGTPEEFGVATVLSTVPPNTLLHADGTPNISAALLNYDGLDFTADLHIYINGLKQRTGATSGADFDCYPSTDQAERQAGKFFCEYELEANDVIQMLIPGTSAAGGGDVTKSGTTDDNRIARWDGINTSVIQNSGITITDQDDVSGIGTLTAINLSLTGDITLLTAGAQVDGVDVGALSADFVAHLLDTDNPHATSIANIGVGSLAQLDAAILDANIPGTAIGDLVGVIDVDTSDPGLPALDGRNLTNLTLANIPGAGTAAALDVGTAIGDVVQLINKGGIAALPVVDGSNLTGISGGTVAMPFEIVGRLQFTDGVTAPAMGQFKVNDSTPLTDTTTLRISAFNSAGTVEVVALMNLWGVGDILKIVKEGESTEYAYFQITTAGAVVAGTYYVFGITHLCSSAGFDFAPGNPATVNYYFSILHGAKAVNTVYSASWTVSLPANTTEYMTHYIKGFYDPLITGSNYNVGAAAAALDYTCFGIPLGGPGAVLGYEFHGYDATGTGINIRVATLPKVGATSIATIITPTYVNAAQSLGGTAATWLELVNWSLTGTRTFTQGDELAVMFWNTSSTARDCYVSGSIAVSYLSL